MYYTFKAPSSDIPNVRVLRGRGVPKITGGYARYNIETRPRRKSVTEFEGSDPITLSLPILFDGVMARRAVELDISNLWRMRHIQTSEPPVVLVSGGIPSPARGLQWLIQNIEEGDDAIWDVLGGSTVRYRQEATVTLLEKISPETIAVSARAPGNRRGNTSAGRPGRHTVRDGQTLNSIAVEHYGDLGRAAAIADANNIRDPDTVKVGWELLLPDWKW